MPMIEHCYRRAQLSNKVKKVFVATCDEVIHKFILSIGGNSVLTSADHKRATTRTAEAVELIEKKEIVDIDIVLMDVKMPGIGGLESIERILAFDKPSIATQ